MVTDLRKTGIGVLGDMPWGMHACLFYETKQDLLDALVPFFKAGLEEGEYCLCVVSERLTAEESVAALRVSIPGLDRYLEDRSLEFVRDTGVYSEGGSFDLRKATERCLGSLDRALARGYAGMRVSGSAGWAATGDRWASFQDYESQLNGWLSGRRILVACMYPLAKCGAAELLDVTKSHQLGATIRNGAWELIETPELKQAKAGIKKLNQQLEQKVIERTQALRAANEVLRREITERKQIEDELRGQKEVLQKIFDHIPVMINFLGADNRIKLINREWVRTLGWTLEEIREYHLDVLAECYPDLRERQRALNFIASGSNEWGEFRTRVRDGRVIDTCWVNIQLSDGTRIGIGRDITERKQVEAQLKASSEQLRALSNSVQAAREEERTRVARLIHDELGSAFTSLKWDLEALDKVVSQPADSAAVVEARAKIARMTKLADTMIETVRRIAWELRPSILDDLGLVEAIEWQAEQFQTRTGIVCRRNRLSEDVEFTEEQATAVFRIFQEALTNILRHARATAVEVTLMREGAGFVVTISDDGRGISWIEKSGLGILGMQERALMVGGNVDIHGQEGAGTTITVRIPMGQVASLPD